MKTNTYLAIIIVLLVLLLGFFAYSISGKAEKRALAHIAEELDSKNSEQMAKLKQIAFDHESIELAYGGFNYLKMMTLEYLQNENKLPNSLADLNLNADWTPSSKIKSVVMQNHAVITITIDNAQSKGTLIFTPSVHQESFLDWQCTTPDIKILANICRRVAIWGNNLGFFGVFCIVG